MTENQICMMLMSLGASLDWAEHAAKYLHRDYEIKRRAENDAFRDGKYFRSAPILHDDERTSK